MALSAMAWPSIAATPTTTTKPKPRTRTAVSSSKTSKHRATSHATGKGKTPATRYTARRNFQQKPTPERYKEIQQALVSKGYLHSEPTGEWNAESEAAMKHFQADQNLTADGKLNSMSLIALGLGPKRLSAQNHTQPAADAPKPEVQK